MNLTSKSELSKNLVNVYLCLVLFLLPLVFNDGFYNISQTKSLFFLSTSILLITIFLIYKIISFFIDKNGDFKPTLLDLAVLLFAVSNVFSSIFSDYSHDVWLGQNSRLQGCLTVIIYAVVYFIISNNLSDKNVFSSFLVLSFCIVSAIAVANSFGMDMFGFFGELTENDKTIFISTIGNINFFGSYVCLCFPFIIIMYCNCDDKIKKYHYLISIILGSFALVLTSSESSVVGFVAFVIIFSFFNFENPLKLSKYLKTLVIVFLTAAIFNIILKHSDHCNYTTADLLNILLHPVVVSVIITVCLILSMVIYKKPDYIPTIKKICIIALSVSFVVIIFLFFYANYKSLGSLDKYFKLTDDWGTNRWHIYKNCFKILKSFSFKEWLIGTGPETLQNLFNNIDIDYIDQAHSEYIQFLLTLGISGLLSYVFIIISVLILVVKKLKNNGVAIALFMGLIAYWFQAVFNIAQSLTTPFVYIFLSIISGIYKNSISEGRNQLWK